MRTTWKRLGKRAGAWAAEEKILVTIVAWKVMLVEPNPNATKQT
jgi:hypothetical protein